jgi:hypothetical protein
MDLDRVHQKLREAQYFLDQLVEEDRRIGETKETFDFVLSAFLNGARTVDYRLRHEQKSVYPKWRETWDASLTAEQGRLMKFMAGDRADEVHRSGSGRAVGQESVKLGAGEHRFPDGTVTIMGMPGTGAVIHKPTYNYTIDGAEKKVTDACSEYVGLLRKLVTEFEAAHTTPAPGKAEQQQS